MGQLRTVLYPEAEESEGISGAEASAYISKITEELSYIEVHDRDEVTVFALTDELRTALMAAGLNLNAR